MQIVEQEQCRSSRTRVSLLGALTYFSVCGSVECLNEHPTRYYMLLFIVFT